MGKRETFQSSLNGTPLSARKYIMFLSGLHAVATAMADPIIVICDPSFDLIIRVE